MDTSLFTGRPCPDNLGAGTWKPLPILQAHFQDIADGSDVWGCPSLWLVLPLQDREGRSQEALTFLCLLIIAFNERHNLIAAPFAVDSVT